MKTTLSSWFFFILPPPVGIPLAMSLSTSFLSSIETFSWNCIVNNYASLKIATELKRDMENTLKNCHIFSRYFEHILKGKIELFGQTAICLYCLVFMVNWNCCKQIIFQFHQWRGSSSSTWLTNNVMSGVWCLMDLFRLFKTDLCSIPTFFMEPIQFTSYNWKTLFLV